MKDNLSDFKQIIFVLYYGLNMRIIESIYNKYLYRVSFIDLQTYEEIKKTLKSNQENNGNRNNYGASKLIITRVFSSYSINKDTVLRFFDYRIKNSKHNDLKPILYVINPLKMKNNLYVTNFYAKQISFYSEEEEIIFLPFSGFIICDIEEKEDYSIIYLNYLNNYEKNVIDYIDAKSKDNVDGFLKNLIKESQNNIFKNIFSQDSLKLFGDYNDKKNVLWIDQYCRCKLYDNYLTKYSSSLKDFYIEKATTIKEAFLILSNHEFKFVYVIINGKLSHNSFHNTRKKLNNWV